MGAVVLLGGYAVYRMITAPGPLPESTPTPLPINLGDALIVPNGAPVVRPTAGGLLRLTNSCAYRGRLELAALGTEISPASSAADVAAHVERMGFDAVAVFASPSEAAAGGTPAFALGGPQGSTRWFRGRWLGTTRDVKPPPTLRLLIVDGKCAQQRAA